MNNYEPIDMSNMSLPKIDLSQVAYNAAQPHLDSIFNHQREMERNVRAVQENHARKEAEESAYRKESLRSLRAIEENTASLSVIVELLCDNNEQQEEMIAILSEALTIEKKKSKKEAEATYVKVLKRITDTVKGVESIQKLTMWANSIWQVAQPFIEQLPLNNLLG